jgi:hypothetical protein
MAEFTNNEYADMLSMYGLARGNGHEAKRQYAEHFPNRRIPHHSTFAAVDRRLRETGTIKVRNTGRPPRQIQDENEQIHDIIEENPRSSTRNIAQALQTNHMRVWRSIHKYLQLHPFHLQKVQSLTAIDFPRRVRFCQWFLRQCRENNGFRARILFTDESTFSRDSITNCHNMHHWAEENPHQMIVRSHQVRFSLNIWCGIIGDVLLGPHILPQIGRASCRERV